MISAGVGQPNHDTRSFTFAVTDNALPEASAPTLQHPPAQQLFSQYPGALQSGLPERGFAVGMLPRSDSATQELPVLDVRSLEQAERMRVSAGKPAGWQPANGGVLKGARAKVMMWDDSALEILPPPPEGNAQGSPTSEEGFSNCNTDLKVAFELPPASGVGALPAAPPVYPTASKQDAALTRLSADAGAKPADSRRLPRFGQDAINALDRRKERCMNPEERTRRWLEQLEVPALSEVSVEPRRLVSNVSGASSSGRHLGRSPTKPAGPPEAIKDRRLAERQRDRPKKSGLLACLTCSTTLD